MIYNDEDNQYKNVTNILKQLQKVEAPPFFEADLMRRINSGKFGAKEKTGFWDKLLSPSRLVPSAAVALIAVIFFFVINTSPVDQDDPLSLNPRLREDLIQSKSSTDISIDDQMGAISRQNENNSNRREVSSRYPQSSQTASFVSSSITKSGLNFRQVTLTDEEKQKLSELREKFKQVMKHLREGNKSKPAEK